MEDTCAIDGQLLPVQRPGNVAELSEMVRHAVKEGQALYPLGGRTMLELGLPPARPGVGVDLRGLNRLIDYPARDMTITVQAGITLADLQALLATERQRLPIDVPLPERATLGGAIAVNVSGSRRLGYGTLRDYVIGMTTMNDQAEETKAGGRVVKNVAGYDLPKLHIGALGTLGLITQVTLKLRPTPEESALVTFRTLPDANSLERLLDQLHNSRTRPVCVDVLNRQAAALLPTSVPQREGPAGTWVVVVGFEESGETVRWQVQQLIKELSTQSVQGVDALVNDAAEPLWTHLRDWQLQPAAFSFKANLLPQATASFCQRAEQLDVRLQLRAHAGNGIVQGHLPEVASVEQASHLLTELQTEAARARGNVVVYRCPPAWKRNLPPWGPPREDIRLMQRIHDKMDPQGLFNPGRFLTR